MPFDSTDYLKTDLPPVREYGPDNPPTRMSEAIRMGVADVTAQEAAGIEYRYRDCAVCTAGAVMRRCGATDTDEWGLWGGDWHTVMCALSDATVGRLGLAETVWPQGFASEPPEHVEVTHPDINLAQWKLDMLALADCLEAEGS